MQDRSGVGISVSPNDNNGQGNGTTSFTRIYNDGTGVTLIAPTDLVAGDTFNGWTGCDSTSGPSGSTCSITMNLNETVTASYVPPTTNDCYEENNTRATAYYPGSNWEQTWLSTLGCTPVQSDEDWYRIDVTPAGFERIRIDLRFTHADGDIDVCLVDSSGTLLTCSQSYTDNEYIDYIVSNPGTYYIKVYYGNAGNTYDLWWDDLLTPTEDDYEENDTLATAYYPGFNWELTPLSNISGSGIQADEDWYKIDVDLVGYRRIIIDLQFTHAKGDIDVCLVDSIGTQLTCSRSITDNEAIDYQVSNPGTYYIKVYYGNAGNTYDLWWDDLASSCPNLPARIIVPLQYFSTPQEACDAAGEGETAQSHDISFSGDMVFDQNKSITLDGGYNCDYTGVIGVTTINGDLIITNGTLTIDNFSFE